MREMVLIERQLSSAQEYSWSCQRSLCTVDGSSSPCVSDSCLLLTIDLTSFVVTPISCKYNTSHGYSPGDFFFFSLTLIGKPSQGWWSKRLLSDIVLKLWELQWRKIWVGGMLPSLYFPVISKYYFTLSPVVDSLGCLFNLPRGGLIITMGSWYPDQLGRKKEKKLKCLWSQFFFTTREDPHPTVWINELWFAEVLGEGGQEFCWETRLRTGGNLYTMTGQVLHSCWVHNVFWMSQGEMRIGFSFICPSIYVILFTYAIMLFFETFTHTQIQVKAKLA